MPQLTQLTAVFASQLFWLAISLGVLYFGVGRAMLPRIMGTIDARESRIADDLAAAQAAREAADATEEAYRNRMNESRAEALKLAAVAKADAARATEARVHAADESLRAKADEAEARLRAATEAALAEIEGVAAEAAQEMAQRLAGVKVGKSEANRAVQAVIHG